MDAHGIQILHAAHRDGRVIGIPHHLEFDLLVAPDAFLHQHLMDGREIQGMPQHFRKLFRPVREAAPAQAAPEGAFAFDGRDYHEIMRGMECSMLKAAIARCDGNMAAASRLLKMDRSTMFRKIRDLEKHGFKVLEGDSKQR